ncbi:hypothetical protein EV426DRAFT_615756 [Tirmania nivea]|nr:hypothetical protein EV426DRAFT_615756 [Tirmania nivea]
MYEAATQMTTIVRPSGQIQPLRLSNNNIPTMTFQPVATSNNAPRSCYNMWSNSTSSTASSNISRGRIRSRSPYEILNSPSSYGSAPFLQLTPSHNGSDSSDSSAWIPVDGEPSSLATGSAGASTRQRPLKKSANPQQLPPYSVAPLSYRSANDSGAYVLTVEGVPTPSVSSSNLDLDGSPGQQENFPQSFQEEFYSNPTRIQAFSHHSKAFPSGLGVWDGLVNHGNQLLYQPSTQAEQSWSGSRLPAPKQRAAGRSSRTETIPVSTSYPQATTTIDTALRMVGDSTEWWKELMLNSHHQSNDQRPLLGIPPPIGLTSAFSGTEGLSFGESAERIQMVAGVARPVANASIESSLDYNVVPIVSPRAPTATLAVVASSTSSTGLYPPSRVTDEFSVLPASGLKRPIEDDPCEVPKNTKLAAYAAVRTGFSEINYGSTNHSLVSFSPRGAKRTRHSIKKMSNDESWLTTQPQSALLGPLGHPDSVDRQRGLMHEQPEAEEFLANDHTALYFEPGIGMPPQLHDSSNSNEFQDQRYPTDDFVALVSGSFNVNDLSGLGFLNAPGHGGPSISPDIPVILNRNANMEGSVGGHGSDIHSFRAIGELEVSSNYFSSNQTSPSPVNTPGESPGLDTPPISFGPVRPPPTHLAVQQPQYNSLSGYSLPVENAARVSNSPFDNISGWAQQKAAAAMAMSWPAAPPCIYVPQLPGSGEEDEDRTARGEIVIATTLSHHGVPQKKKRRAFSNERRTAVSDVRKVGACIRCQYLRESCDKGNPCGNCVKVDGKQKVWGSMPCLRLRLTDAVLFRKGNSKFQQERATPLPTPIWRSNMGKKELSLGRAPPIAAKYWGPQPKYPELRIQCQEFVPRNTDLLFETWNEDGQEIRYNLPAFAACDLEDVSLAVKNYVRESFDLFKYDMINEENPLVSLVFREAIRYTEAHQCTKQNKKGAHQEVCMLKDALKIWILTRLAYEGFGIIRGHEDFGVDVINNPKSPYHGTVPIPPILDHQLDTVGIHEMIRLKDNVLKALKARIQIRRQSHWYEVFLTLFVLLHNLEYIARKQYLYTKRHESTWASNGAKNIEFFRTTWMTEWEIAANMLIRHFQVALKGAVPFTFNWEGIEDCKEGTGVKGKRKTKGKRKADPVIEAKENAGMDDAGVHFMKDVCRLVRENEPDFQRLRRESERREYDRDMVWVSQLFLDV